MKRTRLDKLLAVYERFGCAVDGFPDPAVQQLHGTCSGLASRARAKLSELGRAAAAPMASGLEQGVRDIPDFIAGVSPEWRPRVAQAFVRAVASEYPDFFKKDAKRWEKVLSRGRIESDVEFYLVRYQVERLEAEPDAGAQLEQLNRLLGEFELRRAPVMR